MAARQSLLNRPAGVGFDTATELYLFYVDVLSGWQLANTTRMERRMKLLLAAMVSLCIQVAIIVYLLAT